MRTGSVPVSWNNTYPLPICTVTTLSTTSLLKSQCTSLECFVATRLFRIGATVFHVLRTLTYNDTLNINTTKCLTWACLWQFLWWMCNWGIWRQNQVLSDGRMTRKMSSKFTDSYQFYISLNITSLSLHTNILCNNIHILVHHITYQHYNLKIQYIYINWNNRNRHYMSHSPTTFLLFFFHPQPNGFINIFIATSALVSTMQSLFTDGVKGPKTLKRKVLVDFSSPNIAKEMHVGHLRSTIIGKKVYSFILQQTHT